MAQHEGRQSLGDGDRRYRLLVSGPAVKALTSGLPEKVATAVYEFITGALLGGPRRLGRPLDPPLAPAYSARRGTYRVIYLIDDERCCVEITAVRHRADAYHT